MILRSSNAAGKIIAKRTLFVMYKPPIGLRINLTIVYTTINTVNIIAHARLPL